MTSDCLADYNDEKKALLAEALERFRNAEVRGYERDGNRIRVTYTVGGAEHSFIYDTEKGVLR